MTDGQQPSPIPPPPAPKDDESAIEKVKGFNSAQHACTPPSYPPGSYDKDSTDQPPERQHFVADPRKLWEIGHNNKLLQGNEGTDAGTVVLTYKFLGSVDDTADFPKKKSVVETTITEWEKHANVRFQPADSEVADIRITFHPSKGSWSIVGRTDLVNINSGATTLNLGWLSGGETRNVKDEGTILHEFGHALGMMHEHQSPARGEKITLKEKEVYDYYLPLLRYDRNLVKTQVLEVYDSEKANFSRFDKDSIMMYFMPAYLNHENERVEMNVKLSELDKAYAALIYPYNDLTKLSHALGVIGVPDKDAIEITKPLTEIENVKERLEFVRLKFLAYNKETIEAAALLRVKEKKAKLAASLTQHTIIGNIGRKRQPFPIITM